VEWPIAMVLEGFKEKRGFSKKNSCSITILEDLGFLAHPWLLFIAFIHGKM
jgi:hypothetical protein